MSQKGNSLKTHRKPALVVAIGVCASLLMGCGSGGTAGSASDASSATGAASSADAASASAVEEAVPSAGESIRVTWSSDVPESAGLKPGNGSAATIWYPIFADSSKDGRYAATADAMNRDALEHVQQMVDLYNELVAHKPYGGVSLLPEITLQNDDYLAVHYFNVFDAGTMGTLRFAGDASLYRLSDGAVVSPAELVGKTDAELLALAETTASSSNVQGQIDTSSLGTLSEMLDQGYASYVVLKDGVYLYLRGMSRTSANEQAFLLVYLCDLQGAENPASSIIDLAAKDQFEHYASIDRSASAAGSAPSAHDEASSAQAAASSAQGAAGGSEAEHTALVEEAKAQGKQVVEGTIRYAVGEEAIAYSANGDLFYANGEQAAARYRSRNYAFIVFDTPTLIESIQVADGMSSHESPSVLIALEGSEYRNFGDMALWQQLNGKRACLAISDLSQSSGTDFPGGPTAHEATLLYEVA